MKIKEKVVEIVKEQLGNKEVKETDILKEELGMDELDCVEITMALEEAFGLSIADDVADGWVKVVDIVNYIVTVGEGKE